MVLVRNWQTQWDSHVWLPVQKNPSKKFQREKMQRSTCNTDRTILNSKALSYFDSGINVSCQRYFISIKTAAVFVADALVKNLSLQKQVAICPACCAAQTQLKFYVHPLPRKLRFLGWHTISYAFIFMRSGPKWRERRKRDSRGGWREKRCRWIERKRKRKHTSNRKHHRGAV